MIQAGSALWHYLSPQQRQLARDGALLVEDCTLHPNERLSDYSYLVFPFAKLYEGFLKQLFRDLGIIEERDYQSDHFRIGKVLSAHLVGRLGRRSAYGQLEKRFGRPIADKLWQTWRQARNLVFHYFPHNYRALSQSRAKELIAATVSAMEEAVETTHVQPQPHER